MPVTEEIGRIIMEGGSAIAIAEQAAQEGVWNLRQSGLNKVRNGHDEPRGNQPRHRGLMSQAAN